MTRLVWLALATALATAGCGRIGSAPPQLLPAPTPAAAISGIDVARSSAGLLVTVTAVAPTQGYWNAGLVPRAADAPGQLAFAFVANPPPGPAPVLTERSREITVATHLGQRDLGGIREITVQDAAGVRALRF